MWLVTSDGFYSIVQRSGEADLCVRARDAGDIDRLRNKYLPQLTETTETPGSDYRFRAWASHQDVAAALAAVVGDLHYPNFKSEVGKRDPERAHIYGSGWSARGRIQQGGPYSF